MMIAYMRIQSEYITLLFWRYLNHVFHQQHAWYLQVKTFVFCCVKNVCAVDLTWFLFMIISVLLLVLKAVERKGACLPLPDRYLGVVGLILYQPGPGNI